MERCELGRRRRTLPKNDGLDTRPYPLQDRKGVSQEWRLVKAAGDENSWPKSQFGIVQIWRVVKLVDASNPTVSSGSFPPPFGAARPLSTRSVARAIRALATIFVEPVVRKGVSQKGVSQWY